MLWSWATWCAILLRHWVSRPKLYSDHLYSRWMYLALLSRWVSCFEQKHPAIAGRHERCMPRPSCPAGVCIYVFNDIASFEHRHAHRFTAAAMSWKRSYNAAGFEEIAREAPKNLKETLREHHGPDATLKCRCYMPLAACTRARMLASRGTWVLNCRMGLSMRMRSCGRIRRSSSNGF